MSFFDSTPSNLTFLCSVILRKTDARFRVDCRSLRLRYCVPDAPNFSRPPPPRASPSDVIDVDAINDNDGAKPPARSTSACRCWSVASAPNPPSRPLDPFEPLNYSQSAYAWSAKRKGGPSSKGGKGAPGWVDSSWTSRPNTWTSRPSRDGPSWGLNTREPNTSSYNNNDDAAPNDWVDQSWQSYSPKTQGSTRTNQSDSYYYNDDDEPWPLKSDDEEEYPYEPSTYDATQDWSTPPPSYDSVPVPEPQWQPCNMPQYNDEIEIVEQLRHLGTFRLKPPYQFRTHEDDRMKWEYTKLEPSVLTIASSAMAGQRARQVFLNERHAAVVTKTKATISELGKTINIDSWGRTCKKSVGHIYHLEWCLQITGDAEPWVADAGTAEKDFNSFFVLRSEPGGFIRFCLQTIIQCIDAGVRRQFLNCVWTDSRRTLQYMCAAHQ